mmetsp:Transcript_50455/g.151963  ORF Transcript_50455/g.151963 Transcript_50455/m.151963 type:complete len:367 (-) Transcript_50455:77-1177(-)
MLMLHPNCDKRRFLRKDAVLMILLGLGFLLSSYNFSNLSMAASSSTPNLDENIDMDHLLHDDTPSSLNVGSNQTLFPPFMFYTARSLENIGEREMTYKAHCEEINPNYEVRFFDNEASRSLVAEHFPEFLSLYDDLDENVMRADMWRYLVLYRYGGVYLDFDVECKRPIDEWGEAQGYFKANSTGRLGAMVGIEYRRPLKGKDRYPDRLQFAQWTMASQPGHEIFYRTVELINETIGLIRAGHPPPGDAVYITGPVMFSRAVVEYMLNKGRFKPGQVVKAPGNSDILVRDPAITSRTDLVVGDIAILHEDAFAYRGHNNNEAGRNANHSSVYARHWYAGRWKQKGWNFRKGGQKSQIAKLKRRPRR